MTRLSLAFTDLWPTATRRRYIITVPEGVRVDLDDAVAQSFSVDVRHAEA